MKSEPYHVTRLRGYLWATKEATSLAHNNLFMVETPETLDPRKEITDEVIQAGHDVAEA